MRYTHRLRYSHLRQVAPVRLLVVKALGMLRVMTGKALVGRRTTALIFFVRIMREGQHQFLFQIQPHDRPVTFLE